MYLFYTHTIQAHIHTNIHAHKIYSYTQMLTSKSFRDNTPSNAEISIEAAITALPITPLRIDNETHKSQEY